VLGVSGPAKRIAGIILAGTWWIGTHSSAPPSSS